MVSKYKKIAIIGTSGVGKTTLAKYLSKELTLFYLDSSSSNLWEQYGFVSHEDVHSSAYNDPDRLWKLQSKLYDIRLMKYSTKASFITDRSPIDQCSYLLNYFQLGDILKKFKFIDKLKYQCRFIDAFIFIRFVNDVIDSGNGKRITDPLYQLVMDSIMSMVIEKDILDISNKPMLVLDKWDWDYRVDNSIKFLVK